ncbi:hypothetical protein TAF16_0225 [Anoxybacillus flavithermus]|uniref:Uncharacterized protein n=1 Tax=Anoxybacillus flavithermus TaxID=33934 RepID=A0A178TMA3_9BACL|nr:hypothetical protein TAF16_0225 [Anoxybacillus flavithermus]
MNKEASIEELEHYIVSNWEQHWDYDHKSTLYRRFFSL